MARDDGSPKWDVTHLAASPRSCSWRRWNLDCAFRATAALPGKPAALPESAATNGLALAGTSVFAATDHGLYRSADAGASWERQGRGIPFGPAFDVAVDPENPKRIFAGSAVNNRVYASRDGGESYDELPAGGFSGSRLRRLAVGPRGHLYLASGYDGLFLRVP